MSSPLPQSSSHQTVPSTVLTPVDQDLCFAGRRHRLCELKEPEVEAVLAKMVDEGIPQLLQSHQVVLWRIKVKEGKKGKKDKVKLELDTTQAKGFNVNQFADNLSTMLNMRVEVEERSVKRCCHSGCNSCLNCPRRKEWVG